MVLVKCKFTLFLRLFIFSLGAEWTSRSKEKEEDAERPRIPGHHPLSSFVKVAVVIRWGFLDTQVSLAPTPDSPSSTIVSDFHSVSVSETSQSVQTTMQWPTRWLTWQPTWRSTWWPTWRWTKKTMLMYARERSWCSCSHENEVYWAEAIWCEVYPIRVVF